MFFRRDCFYHRADYLILLFRLLFIIKIIIIIINYYH